MKRRARPLEDSELSQVEPGTWMEVELVHNARDYALRWGTTRLARIINASLFNERERKAVAAANSLINARGDPIMTPDKPQKRNANAADEDAPFGTIVAKPPVLVDDDTADMSQMDGGGAVGGTWSCSALPCVDFAEAGSVAVSTPASPVRTSALGSNGESDGGDVFMDRACFTLPDDWLVPLGITTADHPTVIDPALVERYDACVTAVVCFEGAAATAWVSMDAGLRTLIPLERVMLQSSAEWREMLPDVLRDDADVVAKLQELWLAARKASRTENRPWGIPLSPEFFTANPMDEYYLPNLSAADRAAAALLDPAVVAAKPWLKTKEGRAAVSGSKGRLGGSSRQYGGSGAAGAAGATSGTGPTRDRQPASKASSAATHPSAPALPPVIALGNRVAYATPEAACMSSSAFDGACKSATGAAGAAQAAKTRASTRLSLTVSTKPSASASVNLDEALWFLPVRASSAIILSDVAIASAQDQPPASGRGRRKAHRSETGSGNATSTGPPDSRGACLVSRLTLKPGSESASSHQQHQQQFPAWHIGDLDQYEAACDALIAS